MNDTICAIATPYGSGAISIIRVSGPEAIKKVNNVFKGSDLLLAESHTIIYGHIVDEEIIDEVMVSVMRAPKTFTKEDTIEINCHGGVYVTNKVLETILKQGARLAEPGEFSKRAFLSGRIDLVQAEAIMDMISAKNKLALNIANQSLLKRTSQMIKNIKEDLLNIIIEVEVNIDYPEYTDLPEVNNQKMDEKIIDITRKMENILEKSRGGQLIREGIKTVIIGRPNVGKSSILNSLLEEDKAIVSSIEGTTRDLVEGFINIGGITLKLIDTAGIRETADYIETIGVKKSISALDQAELVMVVLDNSEALTKDDQKILDLTKDKKRIIIVNKNDLKSQLNYKGDIYISASKNEGIDDLENKILEVVGLNDFNYDDANYLSNIRHIDLLRKAYQALLDARKSIAINMEIDMVEIDLRNAFNYLGEIIGESSTEFLIDSLFSRFCLGK